MIGLVLKSVELCIDDFEGIYNFGEGEILVKGLNVMMGYYNKFEVIVEVFKDIDGECWFCIGDVGILVFGLGGKLFLKIIDCKKELFKIFGGKYVVLVLIENKFKEDFFVEQVMVVGEQCKFVFVIILFVEDVFKDWCVCYGVEWKGMQDVVQ